MTENYERAELNTLLEHFYAKVNNKKGEDYEPESLKVMMASLDRPSPQALPDASCAFLLFFFLFYANQAGLEPVPSLFAN